MNDRRSAARAVALVLLALIPAYCSVDGLVTGETLALDKRTRSYDGSAALVTAISYALFTAALLVSAGTFVSGDSKRRNTLAKYAWNVTVGATVLFFAGRLMTVLD